MTPATWPREDPLEEKIVHIDPELGVFADVRMRDLPALLRPGDLLVLNDAATVPASLQGVTGAGEPVEVRLAGQRRDGPSWWAVVFGAGDWRARTEDRPAPPPLGPGSLLRFGDDLFAEVCGVPAGSGRLVELRFDRQGAALWSALYRHGRPVQYSYLRGPLALWHVQTAYGSRPWAVELPSAGRPLTWELLQALTRRGVGLTAVTHAAGLSSTGDAALDSLLPLPERFEVPPEAVDAIGAARRAAGRVVAVGTSVVRALESRAAEGGGALRPGAGTTDLKLQEGFRPKVVDGLLTGLHEPGTSHFALASAFAPWPLLEAATRHAEAAGYLAHEFGDSSLILPL